MIGFLPASTPPELRHDLELYIYQKAVAWLEDSANSY